MLVDSLRSTMSLLSDEDYPHMHEEWAALVRHASQEEVRVVVLGPFNRGKSTLLNALLGAEVLPRDLLPNTGSAILIRYGEEMEARVSLRDGRLIQEKGAEARSLLERFAVLNEHRQMHEEVVSVDIFYPHPLLRGDVTFVDLPGTNDRPAQDEVVRRELFFADVVIQVFAAHEPFTEEEGTKLRKWVLERGIQHVLFVVNFCNRLKPEDQVKALGWISQKIEALAQKPSSHRQVYRVDALPALYSQLSLSGGEEFRESGLLEFAANLSTVVEDIAHNKSGHRASRLKVFADKVLGCLHEQQEVQSTLLYEQERQRQEIDRRMEEMLSTKKNYLDGVLKGLRAEFGQTALCQNHSAALSRVLQNNGFSTWEAASLQPLLNARFTLLNDFIEATCNAVNEIPFSVIFVVPVAPLVNLPTKPEISTESNSGLVMVYAAVVGAILGTIIFPVLGTLIGALIGELIGRGIAASDEEQTRNQNAQCLREHQNQVQTVCERAARDYLVELSRLALLTLDHAEHYCHRLLRFKQTAQTESERQQYDQILLLQQAIARIERCYVEHHLV
jgi:predicted GTPase